MAQRAAPTNPLTRSYEPEPCGGLRSRFAALSRRIYVLGRDHARTLAVYYGDSGATWEQRGGRLLALYALTGAGRALLRGGHSGIRALWPLLQLERVNPIPRRTRAIAEADREARAMYQAAAERWTHAA